MLLLRLSRAAALFALALSFAAGAFAQSAATADQEGQSVPSLKQEADAAREAGNSEEAIRDYSRIVALRPEWAEGWWDLGVMQYQVNHYADAVTSLRKLTQLAPGAAQGWSILGLSEFETKDYSAALASLEKAQKLGGNKDPEIARVTGYHLALLLVRSGDFQRASALLHKVFGGSPPAQAKVAMGLALLRIPLLPVEVDPSHDGLIQAAGEAASADSPEALEGLVRQYPRVPWLHYGYGQALAKAGHPREAIAQQKLEMTVSPESALPWIAMGDCYLQLKNPEQAMSAAQHAIKLASNSQAAHSLLSDALKALGKSRQAAVEASQAERLQDQPVRDRSMIALYAARGVPGQPDDSENWDSAMRDYFVGRYPQAIATLKSWVEQNPDDGTAWAVMGLSEFALKDYNNARIHLQRGIDLGMKGSAEAIELASDRLALLLIRDHQFGAATALLRPLAGHPPMATEIRLALGLALLRIPGLPDGLDERRRELAQSAGAIVEMLLASRYSEAFPAFEKLIAAYPSTPWLHYAYGNALDSLSRYDDAKTQMRSELKLSPGSALPWIRIASISLRQHLPADALKAAQMAVAKDANSADAHYELGRAWLENGEAAKAIPELERANTIKPNTPEVHFVLARAYMKAGRSRQAAAERAEFMRLKAMEERSGPQVQGGSILRTDAR